MSEPPLPPDLITIRDAFERFQVQRHHIYRMGAQGKVKQYKIPGDSRIYLSEAELRFAVQQERPREPRKASKG
jgi:hypothetical protein